MSAHALPAYCNANVVCAIAERTHAVGWPHALSDQEAHAIVSRVVRFYRYGGGRTFARCAFPGGTPAKAGCRVRWERRDGRVVAVFSVGWHAFEDGSYLFTTAPAVAR